LSQIAQILPVLPTQPVNKYYAVYILRFELFHGMVGSKAIESSGYHTSFVVETLDSGD
jgi:hypothetical protein